MRSSLRSFGNIAALMTIALLAPSQTQAASLVCEDVAPAGCDLAIGTTGTACDFGPITLAAGDNNCQQYGNAIAASLNSSQCCDPGLWACGAKPGGGVCIVVSNYCVPNWVDDTAAGDTCGAIAFGYLCSRRQLQLAPKSVLG